MPEKKEPQSFALVIEEADRGRINKILSEKFREIVQYVTDKASLHETEWKAEMTLKIKVKAEPHGKVELSFAKPTTKRDEEGMPKARMYYDPDSGALMNDEPRQVKIPGFDDDGKPRGAAKSASAPKGGSDKH